MACFVFFSNSIAATVPPPLLCSTRLTSLLNMFWAIQQELFFKSILKKFANLPLPKKNMMEFFFGETVSLQLQNLLKWNLTIIVFLEITEIIFWWISQNSYYMEFLQNNWSGLLNSFGNFSKYRLHIYASHKKWKDIWMLCV